MKILAIIAVAAICGCLLSIGLFIEKIVENGYASVENVSSEHTITTSIMQSAPSVTVDVNKMRYGAGEIVHIFGKAYFNSTTPWTGAV